MENSTINSDLPQTGGKAENAPEISQEKSNTAFSEYLTYLEKEKKLATNSLIAYKRDIEHFRDFICQRGVSELNDAMNSDVVAYMMNLKNEGRSKSTINRNLASIRGYYAYAMEKGMIHSNPAYKIKSPKIEKSEIDFLSIDEMEKVLELPDDSLKGMRDKAILELMYAAGMRASELIGIKVEDVNLRMGFVKCIGEHSKARIIPMGRPCRIAMEKYLDEVRDKIAKEDCPYLIVNLNGGMLTRQGLWKILRECGERAELEKQLTPQVIRNSFAIHMLQNGADVKSLQELMGHEDAISTQVYLAFTKNRIKDVYDHAHPRA